MQPRARGALRQPLSCQRTWLLTLRPSAHPAGRSPALAPCSAAPLPPPAICLLCSYTQAAKMVQEEWHRVHRSPWSWVPSSLGNVSSASEAEELFPFLLRGYFTPPPFPQVPCPLPAHNIFSKGIFKKCCYLTALGLHCSAGFSPAAESRGPSQLQRVAASLWSTGSIQHPRLSGSRHRLSSSGSRA